MKPSLRRLHAALAASPWTRPISRAFVAAASLVVLAWVGRSVNAEGAIPSASAAPSSPEFVTSAPSPTAVLPDASIAAPAEPALVIAHPARASPDDPVYLNEATVDDLRRLPGIGDKRALSILEVRAKLGRFRQVDDLLRVKGIGRATLKKLRPLVRLAHEVAGKDAGS